MARRLGALAFGAIAVGSAATAAGADSIDGYRWKSRLLVLASADAADPMLRAQREALATVRNGASERDLVTVEAVGREPKAVALRRRLGLPDDGFRAVLIGKDGGAKLTSDRPIAPQTLFSTIDAMPMRRGEMKR
ncbi:DUF4174 domain-containing protein [Methylobacterium haplocladii]|uniref:DUF4174 domain-containing protein n=1 Tax=Methylobacterium haplocladii TaxID=1176176 RepID=A0A512IQS9_9HYPH|nr:DUF4174 domain-containing protein [Methylobacterium haplocladii]GEP00074.1 hypothetical protein MHA02_24610 [Methylobacterium haplocladii]GLS61257.1 hypothetical protein GCM10007887_39550 [Methylobacterium haplocladii]